MSTNFYAAQASLAWTIGHYFYELKHYSYFAEEFLPYRLENPKSSNPYEIYKDLYMPWKDRDDYDKFINQLRLNIRGGVLHKQSEGIIDSETANRLKRICDEIDISFFYPIIYRINIEQINSEQIDFASSALRGSKEILIADLDESKLDILFLDYKDDEDFKLVTYNEYYQFKEVSTFSISKEEVLSILERRCKNNGIRYPVSAVGT